MCGFESRQGHVKYTDDDLRVAVSISRSVAEVTRRLGRNLSGGTQSHIAMRIKRARIDTSHFTGRGWNKGGNSWNRRSASDILVVRAKGSAREHHHRLHRALKEVGIPYSCELCRNDGIWCGKPLVLEIDHRDGNWLDNRRENLRYLCPNCHAQVTKYGSIS